MDGLVHQLPNPVAVLFEAVKSVLYGLIYGLLYIPTDFFDLVHAARRLKQAFLVIEASYFTHTAQIVQYYTFFNVVFSRAYSAL